jgi:hypothetical protein
MPFRVEIKRILDSDQGQIQLALAMGYVVTKAPPTRRGRTYLKKTYISGPAPKKKAVAVPAGGVGFDMSALSAALDDVADAVAPAQAQAAAGAGPALEWGGEGHIALEVNDADVDGLIAAMGGISMNMKGGKRRGKKQSKTRKRKTRN